MKNKKLLIGLAAALCIFSLTACGIGDNTTDKRTNMQNSNSENSNSQNPNFQNPTVEQDNNNLPKNSNDSNDANSLLALASIKGSVVEFSNDNCTITPTQESEDGKLAIQDAPGHANSDTAVTVHYNSDCVFKIANINTVTGVVAYSDASISDVKKQTSLIIYGDWSNKNNINATAVYIARYE